MYFRRISASEMLDCIHKAQRSCQTMKTFLVGRLRNSCDMTLMLAANRTTTVFLRRYKVLQWSFIIYRVSLFSGIGIKTAKIDSMFIAIDKSRCQIRPDAIKNDIGYIVAIVIEMKTLCRVQTAS